MGVDKNNGNNRGLGQGHDRLGAEIDLDSMALYFGVTELDRNVEDALRVWDTFWGPLGEHEITKATLVRNRRLLLALMSMLGDSLIQDKLRACEAMRNQVQAFEAIRNRELGIYQTLVQKFPAQLHGIRTNVDRMRDNDPRVMDDSFRLLPEDRIPRWELSFTGENFPPVLITDLERVTMFAHIAIS